MLHRSKDEREVACKSSIMEMHIPVWVLTHASYSPWGPLHDRQAILLLEEPPLSKGCYCFCNLREELYGSCKFQKLPRPLKFTSSVLGGSLLPLAKWFSSVEIATQRKVNRTMPDSVWF